MVLVLLAGLLWTGTQAQAADAPAIASELSHFLQAELSEDVAGAGEADPHPSCRKPAPSKSLVTDLVFNEMSDKDMQSRAGLWLALPQVVPLPVPQPALPQTAREPLLRPPAPLG
jgi:hypothetical protein